MTRREAIATTLITLAAFAGACAVPLAAVDTSLRVVIATGLGAAATTLGALLGALRLDPRSGFGGDK